MERKLSEFVDCPECGSGVTLVTNPTACYKCKTFVYGMSRVEAPVEDDDLATAPGSEHYRALAVEPIEVTQHMGFLDGNVVKYTMRFREKGGKEDLDKAMFYLKRLIKKEYGEDA